VKSSVQQSPVKVEKKSVKILYLFFSPIMFLLVIVPDVGGGRSEVHRHEPPTDPQHHSGPGLIPVLH
jgi:hypothetical protein